MNAIVALGALTVVIAALALLAYWQRKIDETQRDAVLAEIAVADEYGTSQPIGQYPLIDEQACIGCGACIKACPEEEVLGLVNGIAKVVHGARCIGHARCAEVCPVSAIVVGFHDENQRKDLPILGEDLATSVPGLHIAGELGGFGLIRNAVSQGAHAITEIAASVQATPGPQTAGQVLDVLIVGAGPAGIAASLKATELNLNYATVDQDDIGGTVRKYPRRKLTLTGELELPLYGEVKKKEYLKEELIEFWEQLIREHELRIHTGVKLLAVRGSIDAFVVETDRGPIQTRRVLLALGRRGTPRKLGVPGEEAEKVLYQLVDAATYTNQHLLIVGGGDVAAEAAIGLASQPGNDVTLSYRRDRFVRINQKNRKRLEEMESAQQLRIIRNSNVAQIAHDHVQLAVTEGGIQDVRALVNDYVFVLVGGVPPFDLLRDMGIRFGGDVVEPQTAGIALTGQ